MVYQLKVNVIKYPNTVPLIQNLKYAIVAPQDGSMICM